MAAPAQTFNTGVEGANPNPAAPNVPADSASAAITEPTDASGIAQKPVPERADPQQAATGPGTGTVETGNAVPFKEQAHGYAKKFHGMFTGNKEEKEFGESKIRGEAPGQAPQ